MVGISHPSWISPFVKRQEGQEVEGESNPTRLCGSPGLLHLYTSTRIIPPRVTSQQGRGVRLKGIGYSRRLLLKL